MGRWGGILPSHAIDEAIKGVAVVVVIVVVAVAVIAAAADNDDEEDNVDVWSIGGLQSIVSGVGAAVR